MNLATLHLLAAEGHKLTFTQKLTGVLVVVFSIGLFCGSIYLLLATDLGARLGFLVAAGCLSGFLVLLSTLWLTNQFPINSLHGPEPRWVVKEIRGSPQESVYPLARQIDTAGKKAKEEQVGDIRATLDSAIAGEKASFQARFSKAEDYLVTDVKMIGGGRTGLTHRPLIAVATIQPVEKVTVSFGEAAPTPKVDPTKPAERVILVRDLGSVRLPQVTTFLGSLIIFSACLLGLHRLERAQQTVEPTPAPAT